MDLGVCGLKDWKRKLLTVEGRGSYDGFLIGTGRVSLVGTCGAAVGRELGMVTAWAAC